MLLGGWLPPTNCRFLLCLPFTRFETLLWSSSQVTNLPDSHCIYDATNFSAPQVQFSRILPRCSNYTYAYWKIYMKIQSLENRNDQSLQCISALQRGSFYQGLMVVFFLVVVVCVCFMFCVLNSGTTTISQKKHYKVSYRNFDDQITNNSYKPMFIKQ